MNFIYCFDEKIKNELELNGYKFIKEVVFENSNAFLFYNNATNSKFTFSNHNVILSNKINF